MKIKIKRIFNDVTIPTHGSDGAAGWDLYAYKYGHREDPIVINPHATVFVHTGLSMAIPTGYFGALYPRSGIASKRGLRLANCVGVIDSDYRGEVLVALHNDTDQVREVSHGERIAQIIIKKYEDAEYVEVDELDNTDRGEGGFGHTGT